MCIHMHREGGEERERGERRGNEERGEGRREEEGGEGGMEREEGEGGEENEGGEEREGGRMDSHIQSWLKNHAPPHVCIGPRFWLLR